MFVLESNADADAESKSNIISALFEVFDGTEERLEFAVARAEPTAQSSHSQSASTVSLTLTLIVTPHIVSQPHSRNSSPLLDLDLDLKVDLDRAENGKILKGVVNSEAMAMYLPIRF